MANTNDKNGSDLIGRVQQGINQIQSTVLKPSAGSGSGIYDPAAVNRQKDQLAADEPEPVGTNDELNEVVENQ